MAPHPNGRSAVAGFCNERGLSEEVSRVQRPKALPLLEDGHLAAGDEVHGVTHLALNAHQVILNRQHHVQLRSPQQQQSQRRRQASCRTRLQPGTHICVASRPNVDLTSATAFADPYLWQLDITIVSFNMVTPVTRCVKLLVWARSNCWWNDGGAPA